jgi:K+-sensing histidine kinase KdpD
MNFVNNFSELNDELIDEMIAEIEKGEFNEARRISSDIKGNLEKIAHHGKRADSIVKSMLQHRRVSSQAKEPTNINTINSVSTKKIKEHIEISVADNGNGIPANLLDKVFQPFFTTKPTEQGTGLGLSLSYDIVRAQGGELKVESKEGEGAEFIVRLMFE